MHMPKPKPVYDVRFVLHPEQDTQYVHFENAQAHPFQPRPAGVPLVNRWWLAESALAAYWPPDQAHEIFRRAGLDSEFVTAAGTDCYVAWQKDWLAVAFRGTQPDQWPDILTDANASQISWDAGRVHRGFAEALQQIRGPLDSTLARLGGGRSVWFCGHSLGAALATLAAYRYGASGVCTLGSPRVGDREFASAFNEKLAAQAFRYVNDEDVVTHVPPPAFPPFIYTHVDVPRFIAPDGTVSASAPAIDHFFADLIGSPEVLLEMIKGLHSEALTLAPVFLLDHMPKAYAIWMWNDYERNG
jgi:triacylglycerol lipase